MIECIFGWGKLHGTMREARHRGIRRAGNFLLNLIAYNLVRILKLHGPHSMYDPLTSYCRGCFRDVVAGVGTTAPARL
jgi:hypothetical protein